MPLSIVCRSIETERPATPKVKLTHIQLFFLNRFFFVKTTNPLMWQSFPLSRRKVMDVQFSPLCYVPTNFLENRVFAGFASFFRVKTPLFPEIFHRKRRLEPRCFRVTIPYTGKIFGSETTKIFLPRYGISTTTEIFLLRYHIQLFFSIVSFWQNHEPVNVAVLSFI